MLQIAVHHNDRIALCHLQTRKDSRFLAEVAGKFRPPDPGIIRRRVPDPLKGPIPGAVADKDKLVFNPVFLQGLRQHRSSIHNILFFVIRR